MKDLGGVNIFKSMGGSGIMANPASLKPVDVTYISSKLCSFNGVSFYKQPITIVKVFEFNGKPVAEVEFHDKSIKIKHVWCRHIAKPKKKKAL